ncbi:histone lysine methyltransferase Set7 [Mucor lusitanicus]|uniref:SET domain-containing protein n=2 Tax=Mucor circinelloides f. lusitanicus TaxID=29924 RepID=A0A168IDP1_MUCCL|nr:hypothetical protein FB192DRAFT_1381563 [Mucor lusitanicus]OAC99852.1 hypothetical protein MUCCIDRAFT_113296 [Mucor lusitanicus CBS 277.49]
MSNHSSSQHNNDDATDDGTIPLTQHRLALELKSHPVRGRGVFTKEPLDRNVLVEISPILLFNAEEYDTYGKHTVLDQYTYCWQGGFALALGLGSMFNHNSTPNVGFIRDIPNKLIRYVTLRRIEKDEELCISYGNHLWFEDESNTAAAAVSDSEDEPFPFQDSSEDEQAYL